MKYAELSNYFLCGIGAYGEVLSYEVGTFDAKRKSFSFSNGSYSRRELFKEPRGGSATYVISATPLQAIDDAELLDVREAGLE